jgi:predicted secreted protein
VTLQLLNKTANPVADITTEIAAEAASHRFYYEPSAGSNITVNNLNNDAAGVPLGITSTWTTTAAATGTMKITLRHYPGNPPNKATADLVNSSKSSTDIEVTFDTRVQ